MPLPKIDTPIFELILPVSNIKIKFRPFLVKEEKILLMAMESNEEQSTMLAVKQILNNCCLDDIDIENLPVTDIEFLFLNLRARSVGEVIDVQYKCNNEISEGVTCDNIMKYTFNALEIAPDMSNIMDKKLEITPTLGIVMKYPSLKTMDNDSHNTVDRMLGVITSCIDYIYDEDTIYYAKDSTTEELIEFIESLSKDQFEKIQKFFERMPKISKEIEFTCDKCGYHEKIVVEGIQNFFG